MRAQLGVLASLSSSILLVAGFVAFITLRPLGDEATVAVDDVLLVAVPALAGLVCLRAARRREGNERFAWSFLGSAALAWSAGQLAWTVEELAFGNEVPFPSWADVGYLAFIPLAGAGLLLLVPRSSSRAVRWVAVLDGLAIGSALTAVSWPFVLRPVALAAEGSMLARAISIAYPVGDIVLATLAVYAAARGPASMRAQTLIVGAGMVTFAIADSGFAYLTATGEYATGNPIDAGWLAGYLLLAVASRLPSRRPDEAAPRGELSAFTAVLPYGPFFLAVFVGAWVILTQGSVDAGFVWLGLVLIVIVATRQAVTIGENMELLARVERANDELRRQEGARSTMLSVLAHDLQTALGPIRSHAAAAGDEAGAVRHLERLARDVRDVARMEEGALQVEPERVDLVALVRQTVDSFRALATQRGVALEARVPAFLHVRADPHRLTQVLYNLIANALNFTPDGGRVVVEAGMERGHARIVVRDSGRGLDADEVGRLFHPFSRVHAAGEAREEGPGLGLFLSRGIMAQHGGRMWCESEGRGRGSSFFVTLPIERVVLRDSLGVPPRRPTPGST